MVKLGNMRKDYQQQPLRRHDLAENPMQQFDQWFQEAIAFGVNEANAVVLATADKHGRPSARVMLLKHYDEDGFVFFTNYESRKSIEITQNPHAALVFWWKEQVRQIRIEGSVVKADEAMSDQYFTGRDREANIGAYASKQSQVIANRKYLDNQFEQCNDKFKGIDPLPRPDFWGGYLLIPAAVEFWSGGEKRLHDRFIYTKVNGNWKIERLAP